MRFIVVGAGPAGLSAAVEARRLGHQVVIFDPEGVGGNALRHSLVPSKVLIHFADLLHQGQKLGMTWDASQWSQVMERQSERIALRIAEVERQLDGIKVIQEPVQSLDPHQVGSASAREVADFVILAAGSRQRLISGMKPDGHRVYIPRIFRTLHEIPQALAIIGGGPTGLEAASLLSLLGTKVSLYISHDRLVPSYHPKIADTLQEALQRRGVTLFKGVLIERLVDEGDVGVGLQGIEKDGRAFSTVVPRVLLATGRLPGLDASLLDGLSLARTAEGFVQADGYGQTNLPSVYAVGDMASGPLLASKAWVQGRLSVRHALGLLGPRSMEDAPLVQAIYTRPEIARVGRSGVSLYVIESSHQPWLFHDVVGDEDWPSLAVVHVDGDDRVVGAEALGSASAEMLSVVALAIARSLTYQALNSFVAATPSRIESLQNQFL